jgi:hypothetical protein
MGEKNDRYLPSDEVKKLGLDGSAESTVEE